MNSITNAETINQDRRRLLGIAAATVAAEFSIIGSANAQSNGEKTTPTKSPGDKCLLQFIKADQCRRAECRIC